MSILTKPIDQITFEDVVAFCSQKVREAVGLDYKRDLSGRFQEVVAAMANTYGGTVVVGAAEDGKSGTPQSPAVGFDATPDVEDTIWRKLGDTIYPPVAPEIRVVPAKDGKTFAVVRVRESEIAPHQIILQNGERRIYVRTGSVNSTAKTEEATLAQIEWMLNRRSASVQLRDRLKSAAEGRFDYVLKSRGVRQLVSPILKIRVAPRFPSAPLAALTSLGGAFKALEVKTQAYEFPKIEHYKLAPAHESLTYVRLHSQNADGVGGFARYVELDGRPRAISTEGKRRTNPGPRLGP